MLKAFQAGRVDAVIGNELLLHSLARNHSMLDQLGEPLVLTRIVSSLFVARNRELPEELETQLRDWVDRLRASGEFDHLLQAYAGVPFSSCPILP
mgnify:CR=1 FL=1